MANLSKLWERVKQINRVKLYEVILPGYKIDQSLFRAFLFSILTWGLIAASHQVSWETIYVHCPQDAMTQCVNPVYMSNLCNKPELSYVCSQEFLPPGFTYGHAPDFFTIYFETYILVALIGFALLNHFTLNKGYKLQVKNGGN